MRTIVIFLLLALSLPTMSWAQEEYQLHLSSIRASRYKKVTPKGIQGDSAFIEYVLDYLLEEPQDVMFISNRLLLNSFCLSDCSENGLTIHDTLKKNKEINIKVFTRPFDAAEHDILYEEGPDSLIKAIDGMRVFGAVDKLPGSQLDSISMKVGKKQIQIPKEAYQDLFQPNLCDGGYFKRPLSVFASMDGQYYYMYIYGGESAGTYLAKLIFDKKRFIKKIVAEYEDLRPYGSIRPDFLGF